MSIVDRLLAPLRAGVVTSSYPAEPPVLAPAARQLPVVDPARCTRDAACLSACPTEALALTEDAWVVDAGRCVFCGACARACPERAIALTGGVTLAAVDPGGLLNVTAVAPRTATTP